MAMETERYVYIYIDKISNDRSSTKLKTNKNEEEKNLDKLST